MAQGAQHHGSTARLMLCLRDNDLFKKEFGFSKIAVLPVVLLGLVYLMATNPKLFEVFAGLETSWPWLEQMHLPLGQLDRWAALIDAKAGGSGFTDYNKVVMQGALLSIPVLLIAALLRSGLIRNWQPLAVTLAAALMGVLTLPFITWACEVAAVIIGVAQFVRRVTVNFTVWISPALAVLVLVALGGAVAIGLIVLVRFLHRKKHWPVALLVFLGAAVVYATVVFGLFDGIFEWTADAFAVATAWIVRHVAPLIGLIVNWLFILALALALAGVAFAVLGQVGRTLFLSVASAGAAARDRGKCADLAAGAGILLSLLLCAAVTNDDFRPAFTQAWMGTPYLGGLPTPVAWYDFLLPDAAEDVLKIGFDKYAPTVDATMLVLVCGVGTLGFLFQSRTWEESRNVRIAKPVMIATGLAIAMALPLLLLIIWARYLTREGTADE